MIKVLHINSTIYINSGVMSVIMNYYKNIDKNKVQFDFLYFKKMPTNVLTYEETIKKNGGKIFECTNLKNIYLFNKTLEKILKENNYNIVHIHDPFILKFVINTIRKHKNIKIIIHSHATKWSDKKISALRNALLCFNNYKHADCLFACSNAAGKFMFREKDFYILNNAIDIAKFKYNDKKRKRIRNELNIDNKIVLGHVGNFNRQKNHEFIINLLEKILLKNKNIVLLLIGDGILRGYIEKMVEEKGLDDNVLFLGKKENVQDYYSAMDIFILPSLYEGLPMVGVEAQCSGLPILFSNSITKEAGLTNYKFIDLKLGTKKWKEEFENVKLPSKEERIKATSIVSEKNFDIKTEANKLLEKYERILSI